LLFEEYAGFSNLGLNLKKTMVIPLTHGSHNIDAVKHEVLQSIQSTEACQQISNMHFAKAAKYLGVMIGPDAELQAWDEPMQKYISRSKRWAQLGIGLNWSIKMYNVFVGTLFYGAILRTSS
jgi:hypothetical protein